MVLKKKFAAVMLALLMTSCTQIIPVKLNLPEAPNYYHGVTDGIQANRDIRDKLLNYTVSIDAMVKLAKNKALCREDNTVLRAIILTTH